LRLIDSSASIPAMNRMKNGSTPHVWGLRERIMPTAWARDTERDRAALLGRHPMSSAISRMRALVLVETPGNPFSA